MKTAGIVAEYNPFHSGHAHQIAQTRAQLGEDAAIVCVMSGNWVQQADCAIADKWLRARLALMGGVDLVLELPTPWATASAEAFARGGAALLNAAGVVDVISFGSECGDVESLKALAACLDSDPYRAGLRHLLDEGMSFAACRQAVAEALLGTEQGALLGSPNNNLGVEYIRALNVLGSTITPMTVLRKGAGYHESTPFTAGQAPEDELCQLFWEHNPVLSATSIRHHLLEGRQTLMAHYLPEGGMELLADHTISLPALARVERAMLARVRTMTAADWAALPDSGEAEGLPDRLERAGRQACSVAQFLDLAKTKRYTHARLRRLLLWAFLGMTRADRPEHPLYLRVLGFNETGRTLLKEMKTRATLPIITKPAHVRELDRDAQRLFELEARCTDLYDLCLPSIPTPGREWSTSPVIF